MALPFLPVIDARQQDTLTVVLNERKRQVDLARAPRPVKSSFPSSSQARISKKRREPPPDELGYLGLSLGEKPKHGREWFSRIRPTPGTTTGMLPLSEVPSHHSAPEAAYDGGLLDGGKKDANISSFSALHIEISSIPQNQESSFSPKTPRARSSESNLSDWRPKSSRRIPTTNHDPPSFGPPSPAWSYDGAVRLPHALPSPVDFGFPQREDRKRGGSVDSARTNLGQAASWSGNWAFPATEIFRACARMLVTPFGDEFTLDPLRVNSPGIFFLPGARAVSSRHGPADHASVLDLGGSVEDEYTLRLAALPSVFLNKVLFHQPSLSRAAPPLASPAAYNIYGFRVDSVLSTSRLSRIPLPNSTVDVISARSLHKSIQAGGGLAADPAEDLRRCLEECHRILVPGGRLEYIYFGDKLLACGPLTGELEPFLGEVWTESSNRAHGQIFPDTNDFLDLLEQVGFKDRSHRSMNFGLFTLRSLYDHRGVPRSSGGAGTSPTALTAQQQQQLGAQHRPAPPCTLGPGSYIDEKVCELLSRVHEECTLRETGWKCVMGYATKRVKRAR